MRGWGRGWSAISRLVGWRGTLGRLLWTVGPGPMPADAPLRQVEDRKGSSPHGLGDETPLPAKLPFYPKDFVGKTIIFSFKSEGCVCV